MDLNIYKQCSDGGFLGFFFFKVCVYSRRSHPLPSQILCVAGGVLNLCVTSTFHTQIRGERCRSVSFKGSEKWLMMWCDISTWCVSFQTIDENSRQSTPAVPPATEEEIKQFYDSLASSGPLLWTHNKLGHISVFIVMAKSVRNEKCQELVATDNGLWRDF